MRFGTNPTNLSYILVRCRVHVSMLRDWTPMKYRLRSWACLGSEERPRCGATSKETSLVGWTFGRRRNYCCIKRNKFPQNAQSCPTGAQTDSQATRQTQTTIPPPSSSFPINKEEELRTNWIHPWKKTTNTHPPGRSGENDSEYVGSWFSQVLSHNRLTPSWHCVQSYPREFWRHLVKRAQPFCVPISICTSVSTVMFHIPKKWTKYATNGNPFLNCCRYGF